jgi:hypothetical protein
MPWRAAGDASVSSPGTYDPSPSVASVPAAQGPLLGSFHFKIPPFTAMISLTDPTNGFLLLDTPFGSTCIIFVTR